MEKNIKLEMHQNIHGQSKSILYFDYISKNYVLPQQPRKQENNLQLLL